MVGARIEARQQDARPVAAGHAGLRRDPEQRDGILAEPISFRPEVAREAPAVASVSTQFLRLEPRGVDSTRKPATCLVSLVGALSYDMGTLDQPADGSSTFDFGDL